MSAGELKFYKGYDKLRRGADKPSVDDLFLGDKPKDWINYENTPSSVDWRTKGVISPVKNQESCGSCWAFGSTETVESHAAINSGTVKVLAPQQFVDCAPNPNHCGGTGGCEGSTAELAMQYLAGSKGQCLESDYTY